jgi:ABC-type multidrug transport system ATPase subunit/ABC-type transport system involved in multi-copper enzyme maturation permease subunit
VREDRSLSVIAEPSAILRTRHLSKRYGNVAAVRDLTLTVHRGEIYGFLGPNGAGKTSTLLMLLGIEPATAGEIELFGCSAPRHPFLARRRIGVVGEHPYLHDELSAWEYLMFFARLYRVHRPEGRARELLERLDLYESRRLRARDHSRGMQQKLGLARALLHEPELLILDEPVSGLDPQGILQVRELLLEQNQRGATILISSHLLSEVERTAHRVGILSGGRLVAEDEVGRIGAALRPDPVIELVVERPTPALIESLRQPEYVTGFDVAMSGGAPSRATLRIRVAPGGDRGPEISAIVAGHGGLITHMREDRASLEDVFVRLTRESVPHSLPDGEAPETRVRTSPRPGWTGDAGKARRHAIRVIQGRDLRALLISPGMYGALTLGMAGAFVVVRGHVDAIHRNHVIVLSDAFTQPFFVAATAAMLFLALASVATVARERAQGGLEVLFYGPVDHGSYVLAKHAAQLGGYVVMTLGIATLIVAYAGLSGLRLGPEFALEVILSVFTAAAVAAFGVFLSALTRGVRTAYTLLAAGSAIFLAIHLGSAMLSGIRLTSSLRPLVYARDLAVALDAALGYVSPVAAFQHGVDALMRDEPWAYLRAVLLSTVQSVVLVAAAVRALRWTGVRR